ncbi:hypothetical protein C9I47_3160 [Lysobacter maris]|uniref:Uncharacterized protein n=1 Tax=Marilutibacter maris TaxID=1605891 RepID=A0A2U9TD82_9GAMM|nr:hypothetical protein C9I47_3160 [Lysobacter maris]
MEVVLKAGDVIVSRRDNGEWATTRILAVDAWPDGSRTFHCLCYAPTATRPSAEGLDALTVLARHVPIDSLGFKRDGEVLCSRPVADEELDGFHEYLKHTDFPRYIEATGQDLELVVSQANAHYMTANALSDGDRGAEAIEEYTRAVELFPMFHEAIDNRGFTHMDLGEYDKARADFEASLRVNPNGHTAFFSRGECLLKLGEFDEAEKAFQEGADRFSEHRDTYLRYVEATRIHRDMA